MIASDRMSFAYSLNARVFQSTVQTGMSAGRCIRWLAMPRGRRSCPLTSRYILVCG